MNNTNYQLQLIGMMDTIMVFEQRVAEINAWLISLDYIGRFENLTEDFQEIISRLNFKKKSLPHKIKGTGADYREYFNDESTQIIADIYKEEIQIFGYSFEV